VGAEGSSGPFWPKKAYLMVYNKLIVLSANIL